LLYVRSSFAPIEFHGEHVWCQIEDLLVGVSYRSTNAAVGGSDSEIKLLQEVSNRHVLLMSDFNYTDTDRTLTGHSVLSSASSSSASFFQLVEDCFLTQHVLTSTRGDAILDLVLTREPDLISNVSVTRSHYHKWFVSFTACS